MWATSDDPERFTRGDAPGYSPAGAQPRPHRPGRHNAEDVGCGSLTGDPLKLDDEDARTGLEFAKDATTVRGLIERAVSQERKPGGPLFVGVVGAGVMLAAMAVVASAAVAYRLPALVTVAVILGGPLVGWALTVRR